MLYPQRGNGGLAEQFPRIPWLWGFTLLGTPWSYFTYTSYTLFSFFTRGALCAQRVHRHTKSQSTVTPHTRVCRVSVARVTQGLVCSGSLPASYFFFFSVQLLYISRTHITLERCFDNNAP